MASTFPARASGPTWLHGSLGDPRLAIGGPRFDALLLWGCPLVSALAVWLWLVGTAALPVAYHQPAVAALVLAVSILTFAHLIAVVPRAYMNPEVFAANRR